MLTPTRSFWRSEELLGTTRTVERIESFGASLTEFYEQFDRHRYLLPLDVCELVDRFHLALGIAAYIEAIKLTIERDYGELPRVRCFAG